MSLFSSQPRIEGGQYQHVPAQPKDYGVVSLIKSFLIACLSDADASMRLCAQSPEDRQEDSDVRMTLAKYRAFLEKMDQTPVRGERKRER